MVWGKIKVSETKFRLVSFLYFGLRKIFGIESFFAKELLFSLLFILYEKRDKANIVHLWHMNKHDVQDQGIYADMPVWIKKWKGNDITKMKVGGQDIWQWSTPHTVHDERMKNATYYVADIE